MTGTTALGTAHRGTWRGLTWGPKKIPVPYIASWSEERVTIPSLAVRRDGAGLCYRDETPADRDAHRVLWSRVADAPGRGRPDFGLVHPVRQRRAVLEGLCQVCAGPASRTSRGWLFLLPRPDAARRAADWPEGVHGMKPPVCLSCAATAVRHCPHLSDPVAVRARKPRPRGVYGDFYTPDPDGRPAPLTGGDFLPYGHRQRAWFLASQLVIELRRATVIDLGAELGT